MGNSALQPSADRVLRRTTPPDLPIEAPTKFYLAIDLETSKGLGLEIPPMLPARADEVIERSLQRVRRCCDA